MDLVNRLRKFIDSTGLTSTQFADAADISRPTLSQILTGRNKKISNELLSKLHFAFPELDIMWLLFGGVNNSNENGNDRPRENGAELNNDVSIRDQAILEASKSVNSPYNTLGRREINDEEIESFASDFFPKNERDVNVGHVGRTSIQQFGADFHSEPTAKQRKIVSITVFYSDNTYETLRLSEGHE